MLVQFLKIVSHYLVKLSYKYGEEVKRNRINNALMPERMKKVVKNLSELAHTAKQEDGGDDDGDEKTVAKYRGGKKNSEEIREKFFGLAVNFSECELDFNTFSLQHHHISILFSVFFLFLRGQQHRVQLVHRISCGKHISHL